RLWVESVSRRSAACPELTLDARTLPDRFTRRLALLLLPLQPPPPPVASASAMRKLFLPILALLSVPALALAAEVGTEKQPIEINATGDTNYVDGIATAHGSVSIHAGDADIYCDSSRYNHKTQKIFA